MLCHWLMILFNVFLNISILLCQLFLKSWKRNRKIWRLLVRHIIISKSEQRWQKALRYIFEKIKDLNVSDNDRALFYIYSRIIYVTRECHFAALSSSSGGAWYPGHTRGQPRGSTLGVRGWFQGDLSEKKICDEHTNGSAWTDRHRGWNSYLDGIDWPSDVT